MKLSELAKCLIYLEKTKYKVLQEVTDMNIEGVLNFIHKTDRKKFPTDFFMVNEFPMNSAFCFIFSRFKRKGTDVCVCPFSDGKQCRVNCTETGKVKGQLAILAELNDIEVYDVMVYLKKIRIERFPVKVKLLLRLWNQIKLRPEMWNE